MNANPTAEHRGRQLPKMSVVLPVHGRLGLFEETLTCLANQTSHEFELIVADDAPVAETRERTRDLVSAYQSTGRTASYVHAGESLGIAGNTNAGLAQARGTYVRQLHSDDLLSPETIEWELEALEGAGPYAAVLFHETMVFGEREGLLWQIPTLNFVSVQVYLRDAFFQQTPVPSGIVVRRDVLSLVGELDTQLNFLVDWQFVSRLLLHERAHGRLVLFATAGLVGWRSHGESVSTSDWNVHFQEHAHLTRQLVGQTQWLPDLWGGHSAARWSGRAFYFRVRRLRSDLRGQSKRELWGMRRQMLACLVNSDSASQLGAFVVLAATAVTKRVRQRTDCEPGLISNPSADVLDIHPTYVSGASPAGARFCMEYSEHFSLARYAQVVRRFGTVRLWDVDHGKSAGRVLREVAHWLGQDAELLVDSEADTWPSARDVLVMLDRSFRGEFRVVEAQREGVRRQTSVRRAVSRPGPVEAETSSEEGAVVGTRRL